MNKNEPNDKQDNHQEAAPPVIADLEATNAAEIKGGPLTKELVGTLATGEATGIQTGRRQYRPISIRN